jgi:glycine/D-amino acid oxidase-like deaminating enzyme
VPTSQPDGSSIGGTDARRDQPRLVPREPGLFLFSALGSRGISWSALGAQVLAALVTGAPSPIEASLLDAVDPARFQVRDARRQTARKPRPAQGGESGLRSGSTI